MCGPTPPKLPARTIRSWKDALLTPLEMALLRIEVDKDALPPEPPADLMPAYRAAIYRLMMGDRTAWAKIHELRTEEHKRINNAKH